MKNSKTNATHAILATRRKVATIGTVVTHATLATAYMGWVYVYHRGFFGCIVHRLTAHFGHVGSIFKVIADITGKK